jgi:DNA-binding NtrC family response regulator
MRLLELPAMAEVHTLARRVAVGSINVLIVGEPGVGKTTLARWIHSQSPRAQRPIVALDCRLSEDTLEKLMWGITRLERNPCAGVFETANQGTVVLEEVAWMPLAQQAILLRLVEDRVMRRIGELRPWPVDVRLISTTSADIEERTSRKDLRQDLMFRLSSVTLVVPPLRERHEDIEPLALDFLAELAPDRRLHLSRDLLERFRTFAWPQNVTQLREVMTAALERCADSEISCEHIDVATLAEEQPPPLPSTSVVAAYPQWTREDIVAALVRVGGRATRLRRP